MRKVLFKRFEYIDGNRVFKDEREGYFHGLHIEGGGHDYAIIEDCETGENYQVEPHNYKFISSEELPINWEKRRYETARAAMQGILSAECSEYHYDKKSHLIKTAVEYADELINQLKTPL